MDTPQMPSQPPLYDPSGENKIIMSKRTLIILIALLVLGLAVFVSAVLYIFFSDEVEEKKEYKIPDIISLSPEDMIDYIDTTKDEATTTEPVFLETDSIFSQYVETNQDKKDFTASLDGQDIVIDWYKGARAPNAEQETIIGRLQDRLDRSVWTNEDAGIWNVYGFVAGVISEPAALAGEPLYLVSVKETGMFVYFTDQYVIYDETSDTFIFVSPNDEYPQCEYSLICEDFIKYDFEEVTAPTYLELSDGKGHLVYVGSINDTRDGTVVWGHAGLSRNVSGIVDVEAGELSSIPVGANILYTDSIYGPIYVVDDQFYMMLPDGSVHIYDYIPYFFYQPTLEADKSMYGVQAGLSIIWDYAYDHYRTAEKFTPAGEILREGCGGAGIQSFPNIVDDKEWFDETKLIQIAKTQKDDAVYTFEDPSDNPYYKEVYDIGMSGALMNMGDEEQDMSDEEKWEYFLNDLPVIVVKDPWGQWRTYRKAKYQTIAECGKPVIYLYPEQETDVHVQVEPDGGFSITDPDYGDDGWFVRASTESELHNYADGQDYEYLFWEGYSYDYEVPCYGWVMSREDVPTRMHELLTKQGMNDKEISDFMEFWEDKLTVSPYVYVTFLPQSTFDEMAPLTVDPAPDTVIRVFMDYMSLDAPIHIDEPYIRTPAREGFTVVEWGGRLH